ncbi:type III restriction protein res subunit [Paenibacillus sp. FSL R7-277]|uniref:DUF4145 domain-containing protein n=1 Tax=Paenibacillus sp. FSL R7-277 TaxID=1227352 RepID=UPI0003E2B087|nr:DUF4145 domain-containing protein [Paenibacillus sp. FSL R7-277]ETT61691.1 type III restriction protein res subunit [Paenibacillus sp. FSL R7-277]
MVSLFSFLEEAHSGLSVLAVDAEEAVWSNPRATLTQGRLFSEELASIVSKQENLENVFALKYHERIHKLSREGILPEEIKTSFEWLRLSGNQASHDVKLIPIELAITAHRHIFALASWYVESYGSLEIETPAYQMPFQPSKSSPDLVTNELVSEHLGQLLNEQIETKLLPTLTEQFKFLHESISKVAGSLDEWTRQQPVSLEEGNLGASTTGIATSKNAIELIESSHSSKKLEIGNYLVGRGLLTIDKRPNNGALWVIGGWELKDELFSLKDQGLYFKFARKGSQSTKRQPAWFLTGKDPSAERYLNVQENQEQDKVRILDDLEIVLESVIGDLSINDLTEGIPDSSAQVIIELDQPRNEANPNVQETTEAVLGERLDVASVDLEDIVLTFQQREICFPASMSDFSLDGLQIIGCDALLRSMRDEQGWTSISNLPHDLFEITENVSGAGAKTVAKFIKQLEQSIQDEKKLIGSGNRKVNLVIAYRALKKKLGRRPTYLEVHQQGTCDSKEFRLLFGSYYLFLLKSKELDKQETAVAQRYEQWLLEAESTIMRKSYKMVVLLSMLERGMDDWLQPITADESAPFFYAYYMDDQNRKSIDFSDDETRKLWDEPLEKTARLITRMPMSTWGSSSNRVVSYNKGQFKLLLNVRENDREILYEWTREICEYRLTSYFERKSES